MGISLINFRRLPAGYDGEEDQCHQSDEDNQEENLPEALRILAGDLASSAVHEDLVRFWTVAVGDKPEREKDVLEGLVRKERLDIEIAISVARDLRAAHR